MRQINEERLDFRKKVEEDFLGIALIELKEIENILEKVDDSYFYFKKHKQIFSALKKTLKKESETSPFEVYNQCTKEVNNEVELMDIVGLTNNTSTTTGAQNLFLILLEFKMEDDLFTHAERSIEYINAGKKDILDVYMDMSKLIESNIEKGRIGVKEDDIKDVMDKLEASINEKLVNPNQITGIPSGMATLDKQLLGFNKKDFLIIAARPSMGKTAFVTTIAKNISVYSKIPTAFFSLEMSSEQLVTRVLSSHSGIGIKKITQGNLSDIEKVQVKNSIEAIKESPLYLYDQASLSITDFKSKVKEIVEQKGVKVVIVDYIQLMSGTNNKNRDVEIGSISRGLKTVAKELDITVIALAQLSRETEKRGDKMPQLSDLRECLSIETSYIYKSEGMTKNIEENTELLSMNNNGSLLKKESMNIPRGFKDVDRITTTSGRFIDATKEHIVLTTDGYKKVKDLSTSDVMIVSKNFESEGIYYKESRLIGLMIGNGCALYKSSPSFITNCKVVSDYFCNEIYSMFGFYPKKHSHKSTKVFQWDVTKYSKRVSGGNPFKNWLKEKDLLGKRDSEKVIPSWFMENADSKSIYELIAGLIETDGSIYFAKKSQNVSFSSTSYELCSQLLYLFAKIGIVARIDGGYISKSATKPCYKVKIQDSYYIKVFKEKIKLIGYKKEILDTFCLDRSPLLLSNKVSRETTVNISKLIKKGRLQIHGNRCATKDTLVKLSRNNDLKEYKWLLSDNIHFDKIKKIEYLGEKEVFDREVPDTNNFIVNGLVVHNCGSIEQDADAVIFLHRPEYYGLLEDSTGESMKGIAEIIFGKNRRGERGAKEKMSWIGETNTFMETVDTITSQEYRDYTEKINSFELENPF